MNQKLKRLRILAGLTHKEAAAKIGVTPSNISHWEHERTFPRANRLRKIADAYGCTIADLLGDESKQGTLPDADNI